MLDGDEHAVQERMYLDEWNISCYPQVYLIIYKCGKIAEYKLML
jgi:hypothetical protein